MKLHVEWTRQFSLKHATDKNLIYALDLEKLPDAAGVYIFGRNYGGGLEALYIGKANNIRARLKSQLKNLPLMMHVKNAKNGKRVVMAGCYKPQPGQKLAKCLALIERGFIRYFLSEGHDLVNKQGSRLRRHEIVSIGKNPKKFIPTSIFLDRAKGE
ncbi:MAG: hypothetical protein IVW56_08200 [Candidatus Binataceae bacterium]|nr:hypothetical protein [Candidatus Binataceae bacterium]